MIRRLAALALCLSLSGTLAPAFAGIVVVDDTGREIRLEGPAQRIVSLAPNVTESLFAVGAGNRVVGVVNYSDYPDAAQTIPRVGTYDQLDIELILKLEPDLVVGWQSGNPDSQVERLRELGLPVYVSEVQALDDIPRTLRQLGTLAGTEDVAAEAIASYRTELSRLRDKYADRTPVSVFYQVWHDPLMTISDEQLISDVIRSCGGRNVFADLPTLAPRIGVEDVLARNPEFIVASGLDASRPESLDAWRQWPELAAVQQDNLYHVPPDVLQRQTARIIEGMEMLCRQIDEARTP